ncbi:AAA family ATPase [Pedobacter sp. N23S346]|uniref:AAA family ATPase n=1 Tax=Pedobacter sp. N23S346 TaxID=3402750 RepID=UPI003AC302D1
MDVIELMDFFRVNPNYEINTNWVVITGAPSSGKTTLIEKLKELGYATCSDISRELIENRLNTGMTLEEIYRDEHAFQSEILAEMINKLQTIPSGKLVFHDYCIPDNIPFLKMLEIPVTDEFRLSSKLYRFKKVFICEPFSLEIDGIRRESSKDQLFLDMEIENIYEELGYSVIRLPATDVNERIRTIQANVSQLAELENLSIISQLIREEAAAIDAALGEKLIVPEPIAKLEKVVANENDESIEDQFERSRERILRIKDLSIKLRTTNGLQELENEPAYKRKQMQKDQQSSESQSSRFTLRNDEGTEIIPNSSFLHDNVD